MHNWQRRAKWYILLMMSLLWLVLKSQQFPNGVYIMAIKAVIFDIGGVLLHNNGQEKERAWETQAGLPEGAIFKFINRSGLGNAATRGKLSRQELWSKVSEHFKIDLAQIRTFEANLIDTEVLNTELAEFL